MMRRHAHPVVLATLGLFGVVLLGSCITDEHPLGTAGGVSVDVDIAVPLFAANQLDSSGNPILPRQTPFSTSITLSMTEDGQPAWGAYVDLAVEPPEALTLASNPDETSPTCTPIAGGLRCRADEQGNATLMASSQAQWSGTAKLDVDWGGNAPQQTPITILPAGLPPDASAFSLLVGGLSGTAHVLATYDALQCTTAALPADLGTAWRPGMIRSSEAFVTASPSPTEPASVANAPVLIESLSAEAEISLLADCSVRTPALQVTLGDDGQSPSFYLCFSDNGGTINFNVTSGVRAATPQQQVIVDPEPRLLRVVNLLDTTPVSASPVNLFEVDAYNASRVRIALPVDLSMGDNTVLALSMVSTTTVDETGPALEVSATALMAGTTTLTVTPSLFSMPACVSSPVVVTTSTTPTLVNGCDPSMVSPASGTVIVTFPTMGPTAAQYSPNCVSVHVGNMVTFEGDFTDFPLSPGPDVVANNPIMFTNMGTSYMVSFPTAGQYGFYQMSNPTLMLGAVFVVP
jgi:hypothetical protein